MKLDDQFEWDIENPDSTPEQFAEIYGNDLGLAGEFKFVIFPLHDSSQSDCYLGLQLLTPFVSK